MAAGTVALPPGFVLEPDSGPNLPPGFQLEAPITQGAAALQGAAQGATLGFGDEMAGLANASGPSQLRMGTPDQQGRPPSQSIVGGIWKMLQGDPAAQQRYQEGRDAQRGAQQQAETQHPVTYLAGNVGGSMLPMLATAGAGELLPVVGALAAKAPTAAKAIAGAAEMLPLGLVQGAGEANTMADVPSSMLKTGLAYGIGGVAAPVLAKGIGTALSPAKINPATERLAAEGVDTTAGQKTGSRLLQMLENQYSQIPGMGGAAGKTLSTQRDQLAQAVMKRMGVEGEAATIGARTEGKKAISDAYDALKARTSVNLGDDAMTKDLEDFGDWASRNLTDEKDIEAAIKKVRGWARFGDKMPGEYYKKLSSELGASNNPADWKLKKILNDAFRRSVSKDDAAELAKLDQQWLSQKIINDAMGRAGTDAAETGAISPGALAGAARGIMGREAYGLGKGPLTRLSQDAQKAIPNLPDSGTPTRLLVLKALSALAPGAAVGGASYAQGNDPMTSLALALAGPRMLTSRAGQKLLTNQVGRKPAVQAAIARALAVPTARLVGQAPRLLSE
jgi:hypothetical protein